MIYRFGASLYYANANRFTTEVRTVLDREEGPPSWFCIESGGIGDVDFSGGQTLLDLADEMQQAGTRMVFAEMTDDVRAELDRYGVSDAIGQDAYFDTPVDVMEAFRSARPQGST